MISPLSAMALSYGLLWLGAALYGNIIFTLVVSGFGALILIVVALSINDMDEEIMGVHNKLKSEVERLSKELEEIKNKKLDELAIAN